MSDIAPGQAPAAAPTADPTAQSQVPATAAPAVADTQPVDSVAYSSIDDVLYGDAPLPTATTTPPPAAPAPATGMVFESAALPAGTTPPAVPPTATIAPTPTPTPAPAAAPGTQQNPVEERILPNRINTNQYDDGTKRLIAAHHAINDGLRPGDTGYVTLPQFILQQQAPAAAPGVSSTVPAIVQDPVALAQGSVETAKARIAELQAQRLEFAKNESLYTEDIAALDQQINDAQEAHFDAKLALRDVEKESQTAQQRVEAEQRQTAVQRREQDKAKALADFPSAGRSDTPLGAKVVATVVELEDPNHPDHGLLWMPNAAQLITERSAIALAKETATQNGTSFAAEFANLAAPTQQTTAPAGPAEPPRPTFNPAPGGSGTAAPGAPKTEAQVLAEAGNDPNAIDAALYGNVGGGWIVRG